MRRFAAASVPDFSRNFPKNQCTKWFDYDKIKGNVVCEETGSRAIIFLISGREEEKPEAVSD